MQHNDWKRLWMFALLSALIPLAAACGSAVESDDPRPEHERNAKPAELNSKVFVTAQELQAFADDGATILDSRDLDAYEAGHLPGAVQVTGGKPWKDSSGYLIAWKTEDGELVGDVVAAQNKVRALGIDRDRPVVIYADTRSKRAGRLFWTLEYYGHGQVYLYPNSYQSLLDELEFDEETDAPDVETGDFVVAFRNTVLATVEEIQTAINNETAILIDTRREGEYEGTEDRDDPRQGRLPGAIWYHYEEIFDEDGALRDKQDLQEEFESLGFLQDGAVLVPYCQTGTRSAYVYAVLRWLGRNDAQNYDGSWVEWSRNDKLDIE